MNGDQQRQHKTVRDELAALVGVVEALEQRDEEQHADHTEALAGQAKTREAEFGRVNRRLVDLQMNLDAAVVEQSNTDSAFQAFRLRGFWNRVNWLVTGR